MNKVLYAVAVACLLSASGGARILLYNGDAYNGAGLNNTVTPAGGGNMIFENFIVPVGGWDISGLFSKNEQVPNIPFAYTATGGMWEIWTHLGSSGQTLVASGTTTTNFSWTPTGRGIPATAFPEYTLLISGINLQLDPGTYWFGVSPFISDGGTADIGVTAGANAIGMPLGDSGTAFRGTPQGTELILTTDFGSLYSSFTMGVDGVATPEPATGVLLAAGVLSLRFLKRRSFTG